ncbi:hypothetical protein [Mesorhizobium sp. IMUNJ 23232]|uniref:hypothetical protein n=1 Tax=Mesorhizobium sp. IMUNJ 23232 TaxID=3376064 RepID=UPI0037B30834
MPEWFGPSKDVVLLVLAVWGAALSTFNWWSARSKESRRIKVWLTTKIPTYTSGEMGHPFVCVEAVNVGHRPVKIDYLAVELPDGRTLLPMFHNELPGMPNTKLPVTLGDGESAILAFPYSEVGHGLRQIGVERTRIRPLATDTAGNKHRGKSWKVTASEMIEARK